MDNRELAIQHMLTYPWGCRHQGCDVCRGLRRKVHHVDLLTSTGELTSCRRTLNEVPGPVSPFWEVVTCRSCIANGPFVRLFKVFPRPK